MSHYTADKFVESLNHFLKVQPPNIIEEKKNKDKHESSLFPAATLQWKKEKSVDCVVEGPCSDMISYDHDFPLGKCIVHEHAPDKSWIHSVIDQYKEEQGGQPPKNVVLYPDCCYGYTTRHQKVIRQAFPDIIWSFPQIDELCGNFHPKRIAEWLVKAGYLEIVPATETTSA
jgi:hypothetical protein